MKFSLIKCVYLLLLLFSLYLLIRYIYFVNNECVSENESNPFIEFVNKCNISKLHSYNITHLQSINTGWILWDKLNKLDMKNKCKIIKRIFNIHKIKNDIIFNRLYNYNNKSIIDVKGEFLHESYYRMKPNNKNSHSNIMSHTYKIQNYIFQHQNPQNCENKSFLILSGFDTGHGSEIHVLGTYLALALTINRIAVFDPFYENKKSFGDFCGNVTTWECFFEPLTNCSIPKNASINTTEYQNSSQTEKYLYLRMLFNFVHYIPPKISEIVSNSVIPNENMLPYWRMQSATYIFRLNEKTDKKVNKLIKESVGNGLESGCINVWVRHGDKYKEMQLLTSDKYLNSVRLFNSITNRRIPIYLSSDDPEVIKYFKTHYSDVYYLKFQRLNDNYTENLNKGDKMTLNFIADVKAALHCIAFSGTRQSNVVRIIDELKNTVGFSLNYPYFENGYININENGYEKKEFW